MDKIMYEEQLSGYIGAKVPIIYVNTYDDNAVTKAVIAATGERKVWEWNCMDGLLNRKMVTEGRVIEIKEIIGAKYDIKQVLEYGVKQREFHRKVVVVKDIADYLYEADVTAFFKNACSLIADGKLDTVFVFVSSVLKIPGELDKYIMVIPEEYPTEEIIKNEITGFIEKKHVERVFEKRIEEMTIAFKGLSIQEINTILALARNKYGKLDERTLDLILVQKRQMIEKAGILEMVTLKDYENMDNIGGLEKLQEWVKKKAGILKDWKKAEKYGVDMPKGVLIVGIPGCGKSLTAKATAKLMNIPLLKLDMGRLLGKYVGESESNMRRAVALAEAVSPCVLWVDELEKAFAGIGESGGGAEVTTRLFGHFLTWMQEKEKPVFVVATANNISKLPPELLRKGRFDEIFSVSFPNDDERRKIFEIHIKKRRSEDFQDIDISELVRITKGRYFSGADIESIVKETIETAFINKQEHITTEGFKQVIKRIKQIDFDPKKWEEECSKCNFKSAS